MATFADHITSDKEAYAIMIRHHCKSYKQTASTGKILAAYELDDGDFIWDVTEREQLKQSIEEQKKVLKRLEAK